MNRKRLMCCLATVETGCQRGKKEEQEDCRERQVRNQVFVEVVVGILKNMDVLFQEQFSDVKQNPKIDNEEKEEEDDWHEGNQMEVPWDEDVKKEKIRRFFGGRSHAKGFCVARK